MGKLSEIISKTKVTHIKLEFNGEKFKFNLIDELVISEKRIQKELEEQPSYYGFLLLLRNRLLTVKEDAERELEKVSAHEYKRFCETNNPKTNRLYADKTAKELVYLSPKYDRVKRKSIKAKQDYNDINACVLAFDQRSNLMQTIAANLRREK
jgi:hypothetical protein